MSISDRSGGEPLTAASLVPAAGDTVSLEIPLYAKGRTTGGIQAQLADMYGSENSRETISKITDEILADMVAWQNRPLDGVYTVLLS